MEYYYCNQFTNATREDEPAEYEEPPSKAILKMFVSNPLLRAALVIQEAWFERAERHVKMIAEARKNARNAIEGWVTGRWDFGDGKWTEYYVHCKRGLLKFQKPDELFRAEIFHRAKRATKEGLSLVGWVTLNTLSHGECYFHMGNDDLRLVEPEELIDARPPFRMGKNVIQVPYHYSTTNKAHFSHKPRP